MVPDAEVMPCPQMLTVTVAAVALQVRVYVPPEGPSFQLPPEVGPLVMVTPLRVYRFGRSGSSGIVGDFRCLR